MSRLDNQLWPVRGPAPYRDQIIEFVEDLQYRLLSRASVNLDKILGKAAVNVRPKPDEQALAQSEAARAARDARLARHR